MKQPLAPSDAIAAGHTLRALAQQGRPNPETAELLGRVGNWLVDTAQDYASATAPSRAADTETLVQRARYLLKLALTLSTGDIDAAADTLMTALCHLLRQTEEPRRAFALAIATMADVREQCPSVRVEPLELEPVAS